MKKLILFCSVFSLSFLTAQNRQITFETGNWASVLQKAKKENKLIFIDAYTTWCGPCKHMAKHVFTKDSVADYFNSKFVNYKMDMEKGEGIEFAKKYQVNCYPNLLFIDGNENLVHRGAGSMGTQDFISFAGNSMNPKENFTAMKTAYEKTGVNESNITAYIDLLSGACLDPSEKVTSYIKTVKEEDLMSRTNWVLMRDYVSDHRSREMTYFLKNIPAYETKFGKDTVSLKLAALGASYFSDHVKAATLDKAAYEKAKKDFEAMKWPNSEKILFDADMRVNKKFDKDAYYKLAASGFLKYNNDNAPALNSMAWTFYEKVTDASQLKAGVEMARRANELKEYYAFMDTYAAVLYKAGNYSEAEKMALKAIDKAKLDKMSEDEYKETSELLKQIRTKLNSK
ncbi:MAG: thiol:disulfide interchange protein [Bacteroidetes bacterium]|jgi:thiol-disulfide isomerase/thioredoxin|nr:thiol:disulfide interchange protein [Bacteroidota bacterium]